MNAYQGVPIPVLILFAVALIGVFLTNSTVFGRYLYAIGGNADAARLSGINNKRNILKVLRSARCVDRHCGTDLHGTRRKRGTGRRSAKGTRRHRRVCHRRSII